jgi:hypothetical protein
LVFWPLAIGLLLQTIAGRFRDPVDLLLVLLAMALGSIFLGLVFTAGWRASLRWDLARAEAYRRHRLDIEAQLFSPEGYAGWRGVTRPDGSRLLVALEDDDIAA